MNDLLHWTYLPHALLLAASLAVFTAPPIVTSVFIGLASAGALANGEMDIRGLFELSALAYLLYRFTKGPGLRVVSGVGALVLAVLLSDHALTGFVNPIVLDHVKFTADAAPFTMYLNFEKTMVGLLILLIVAGERRRFAALKADWVYVVKSLGALIVVMMGAAWATGYVAFEPKWPAYWWFWMINNLFFVCLAEEALFRGFLLEVLLRVRNDRAWRAVAIGVSALGFGLMHHRGGVPYVALATLAGAFYGHAYVRTRRVQASMLIHFGLNLVHLLLFTYPSLQGGTAVT